MSTRNLEAFSSTASPSGVLTCSLASLATGSARESAVRACTGSLNLEEQVAVTFTIASGTPSTSGAAVNVYVNGSIDSTLWPILQTSTGTTYQSGQGDASAGALGSPPNIRLIGSFGLATTTSSGERTFRTQPLSVSSAFAGALPPAYSIFVENQSGVAFSTSTVTTAQLVEWQGIFTTSGN